MRLILLTFFSVLFLSNVGQAQTAKDTLFHSRKLCLYAQKGELDSVITLIRRGADPNYLTPFGITALMYATEAQHVDVVKTLLHNGANPDKQPFDGFSPLMHASYNSDVETAYALLRYGAKLELQDVHGVTALHYAVFAGAFDIVDMQIFYKANVNARAKDGNSPLHVAMFLTDTTIAAHLIFHGADINAVNKKGYTPLMLAAQENNIAVVKMLVEKGANSDILNDTSYSALSYSILYNHDTTFYYLLDHTDTRTHHPKNAENPINLTKLYSDRTHTKALKEKGFKTNWMPVFCSTIARTGISFNGKDIYFKQEVALLDLKYNMSIGLGFSGRINRKPVLLEIEEDVFYQVHERKHYWDLNVTKYFALVHENRSINQFGLFTAASLQFASGKYIGLDRNFDQRLFVTPSAGAYLFAENLFMSIGYAYTPYGYEQIPDHKFEFWIGFAIPDMRKPQKHYPTWF